MGSWISFKVKCDNQFIPLCSFRNSNHIYDAALPYVPINGKIMLDNDIIYEIIDDIKCDKEHQECEIKAEQEMIESLGPWNNTVEQKMEAVHQLRCNIAESRNELNYINEALSWFQSLAKINEEYTLYYSGFYTNYFEVWAGIDADWEHDDKESEDEDI